MQSRLVKASTIQILTGGVRLPTLIIICVASVASLFLIVFGAVTNQAGILSTGTGILGVLLGYIGAKNQPAINAALCKLGLHKWEKQGQDGVWKFKECKACFNRKQTRLV